MKPICVWLIWMCVVGAPTWASGQPVPIDVGRQALVNGVKGALDTGRFEEAYELAKDLVALYPEDATVRHLAAAVAFQTVRRSEARGHLDAGLALSPGDAGLLGLRANLSLVEGAEAAARQDARRAIEIDPSAADALYVIENLELTDRARSRREGADPGIPRGSPAEVVDRLCERVAAGAPAEELADAFGLEILDSLDPADRTREGLVALVRGLIEASRRDHDTSRVLGWYVLPETLEEDGRHWVTVHVPMITVMTPADRRFIAAAHADPSTRDALDAHTRALLDGASDEDRSAVLDRMVGTTNRVVQVLYFLVAPRAGGDRIVDVVRDGASVKEHLAAFGALQRRVDGRSSMTPYDLGYAVGKVIGGLLIIGLCVWAVRWLRRH